MRTTEQITNLAAALAIAQGGFANPSKDREVTVATKTGGTYKFKYATFAAVVDAVRKPLADNGLSFVQATTADAQGHVITTRLLHASGQWMEFDTPVFVNAEGAQAFGSGVTYAKRYALSSMLGVTADEDDDGNGADGNAVDMKSRQPPANNGNGAKPPPPTPAQTAAITNDTRRQAAATYVNQSIAVLEKMLHQPEYDAWAKNNKPHLAKLERDFPALHEQILEEMGKVGKRLPHTNQAA